MVNHSKQSVIESSHVVDAIGYRQLNGLLQYLLIARPNVAYVVNKLSHFMHVPNEEQCQVVKCVLRYLNNTFHHGLLLKFDVNRFF